PLLLNQIGRRSDFTTAIRATGGLIAAQLMFVNLAMKIRLPSRSRDTENVEPPLPVVVWKSIFTDVGYLSALTGQNLGPIQLSAPLILYKTEHFSRVLVYSFRVRAAPGLPSDLVIPS
ncbi:hypothetical protein DFH09DRAFT_958081, partial [Mycena vulgaris]